MTLDALTRHLRCPACGSGLALERHPQADAEVGECGLLQCECSAYPVLDGVPMIRAGALSRRSIADGQVMAPGLEVAEVVRLVEAGRALDALVDVLSPPVCPWPLNYSGAGRRLSLAPPVRAAGLAVRRRRVRRMLARRDALTAEDWLAALYWHAPEIYDPFNYFFFRFGTPRHLAPLGMLSALPAGGPVLDLASGCGHLGHTLSAQGRDVVGLDQNAHQAWLARHYVAPGAAFVCADADAPLPFHDGAFASAFCSDAFHYIRGKGACLGELDRATSGGPVFLITVGNGDVGFPDGHELDPAGYAGLLDGWSWVVCTEADTLERYLEGHGPDLSASAPAADVAVTKWLSYVATRQPDGFFRDHGPLAEWPHASGALGINPLYKRHADRLSLRLPSLTYEIENGGVRAYMPAVVSLEDDRDALIALAVVVGQPERYRRPTGRPWTMVANRHLHDLVRQLRGGPTPAQRAGA